MKKQEHRWILWNSIIFFFLLVIATWLLWPYMKQLSDPVTQAALKQAISDLGFWGIFIVLAIQILQIVIAFIPGGPIQILSGVLYGTIDGLFICLIGSILASALIFSLSKRFGKKLLYLLFSKNKVDHWYWLQDSKRMDMVIFILFLTPGIPKDMLTYIVGVCNIPLGRFLLLSTLGRTPSILFSTMIGMTMSQGNWLFALLVFLLTVFVGLYGILKKERWIARCRDK